MNQYSGGIRRRRACRAAAGGAMGRRRHHPLQLAARRTYAPPRTGSFSTDPNSNTGYPDASEFNSTVLRDRGAGVKTMGTVPMIGWTTKRERACGYAWPDTARRKR